MTQYNNQEELLYGFDAAGTHSWPIRDARGDHYLVSCTEDGDVFAQGLPFADEDGSNYDSNLHSVSSGTGCFTAEQYPMTVLVPDTGAIVPENWWVDRLDDDGREESLPKWAQERLRDLRRQAKKLSAGVIERSDRTEETRVAIELGGNGGGGRLYRPLPDNSGISLLVDGGEMRVELAQFGDRYRLRITGHGSYDYLQDDRPEIAVLPALGNVVEVAFVMPVSRTIVSQPVLPAPAQPEPAPLAAGAQLSTHMGVAIADSNGEPSCAHCGWTPSPADIDAYNVHTEPNMRSLSRDRIGAVALINRPHTAPTDEAPQ